MNILFTFPFFIDPQRGGTERVTYIVARELKRRGHNIYFLSFHSINSEDKIELPGKAMSIKEYEENDKIGQSEYAEFLKSNDIDIIINQGGIMASCRFFCHTGDAKAKVITVLHINPRLNLDCLFAEKLGLQDIGIKGQIKRILRIAYFFKSHYDLKKYLTNHYKKLMRITNKLVLLSEKFKDEFLTICPDAHVEKIAWINNPLTYEPLVIESKSKIILFVGRMSPQKMPLLFLRVWEKINKSFPDWRVLMLGDGTLYELIKEKSKNIERIDLKGTVNPEEYFRKASVLCMTSGYEGWGMVLVEAMACGCVPIAFDSYKSCSDILPDRRQRVTPFSISEYCTKLSQLLSNSELRDELAEKGYTRLHKFATERIGEQWENLILDTLNE